jgi:two-component system sensor histidine kinase KdpD
MNTGTQPSRERLMVCISAHPLSERLVNTGKKLAADLKAEWYVVYVETPERLSLETDMENRVKRILHLAEQAGAKVITLPGRTVPEGVIRFARENSITKIIIGKPLRARWQEVVFGSPVDEILHKSGTIDVYIITDSEGPLRRGFPSRWKPHAPWSRYLMSVVLIAVVTLLGVPIHLWIEPTNLVMIYLLAVILAALYLGRGPSILTSILSVLSFDFFFVKPRFSLSVDDTQYILTFLGLFLVGLLVSSLTGVVRDQVEAAQRREVRITALYNFSQQLSSHPDLTGILQTILQQVSGAFEKSVVLQLRVESKLRTAIASPETVLTPQEMVLAEWCCEHAAACGRSSNHLPDAPVRFQPLSVGDIVIGVLCLLPWQSNQFILLEQRQLLEAYANLAALAIERTRLAEQANQARLLAETEKLQAALLNSISHDLRTPLATITGSFSSLLEAETNQDEVTMDPQTRLELIETGMEEAERLNQLVGNLLDMTRLESGALRLNRKESDIEDLIGAALLRFKPGMRKVIVRTSIPATRPVVWVDFVLIQQVLINLLDNSVKYSPAGAEILLEVKIAGNELLVSVNNQGPAIPMDELERVFEKFHPVRQQDHKGGTGLGLSICKGIVEAHQGRIWAENRSESGVRFTFALPLTPANKPDHPAPLIERRD